MPFASTAFGQLKYVQESSVGVTPASGGILLRMTQPTLKAAVSVIKSEEIRADRLASGSTRVDLNIDGGFDFELSVREYDPLLIALLANTAYTHFGTLGLGALGLSATPTTYSATLGTNAVSSVITAAVAPAGTSAFAGLVAGSWFKVVPDPAASATIRNYYADAWFKVLSNTTTSITLDLATPILAAGVVTTQPNYRLSQSVVSNGNTSSTTNAVATSFSLEYHMTDIAQFLTYSGMQVNSFDLTLDVGSIVKGSFDFFGRNHTIQGTTAFSGVAASQSLEVMNSVADVGLVMENNINLLNIVGGSFIKSVKLNVNNNARGQKAVGVFGNAAVSFGELAISGALEVYMENAIYYNKWLQGTNTSLAFGMADSAGNGYLFELDKVNFKEGAVSASGRNSDTMLTLPFDAFFNAATNRGIRITRAVAT